MNVTKTLYDKKYYFNLKKKHRDTAEIICKIRWNFVLDVISPKVVLDYGCGCNYLTKYAPEGTTVDSYDIGTINGKPYPQTGIRHNYYDLIFFNDILEHIDWENNPDLDIIQTFSKTNHIAITIPICPLSKELESWKHYKPGEHLTYFTKKTIKIFFDNYNFSLIKIGMPECPPREDIYNMLFERKEK
jgi:hypothetical protein